MIKIKVAINGYGVIGKRIADAVALQDDMEVAGVCDIITDWRINVALKKIYRVYAANDDAATAMKNSGITISGMLNNLLMIATSSLTARPKK